MVAVEVRNLKQGRDNGNGDDGFECIRLFLEQDDPKQKYREANVNMHGVFAQAEQ
jgi:hypothetical protein